MDPRIKMVKLLLKHGADVNVQNNAGETPAHSVLTNDGGNLELMKEMKKYGADFTIKNNIDETPLLLLMKNCVKKRFEHNELIKYLIKCTLIQMSKKENLETVQIEPTLKNLFGMFDEGLLRYYQKCASEVIRMKGDFVLKNKSVLDLVDEGTTIDGLNFTEEENTKIVKHIFQQLVNDAYPLLGIGMLTDILSRKELKKKLSELQVSSAFDENQKKRVVNLDSCCLLNIAKYLCDEDLISLILAIHGGQKSNEAIAVDIPTKSNVNLKRSAVSCSYSSKRARS